MEYDGKGIRSLISNEGMAAFLRMCSGENTPTPPPVIELFSTTQLGTNSSAPWCRWGPVVWGTTQLCQWCRKSCCCRRPNSISSTVAPSLAQAPPWLQGRGGTWWLDPNPSAPWHDNWVSLASHVSCCHRPLPNNLCYLSLHNLSFYQCNACSRISHKKIRCSTYLSNISLFSLLK
jgi:hypothetical protein